MTADTEVKGPVLVNPKKNQPELRDNRRPDFIKEVLAVILFKEPQKLH